MKNIPSFSLDTCIIKKDKSALWCRVTSMLFQDENETLGYTIIEDVSNRKHLQKKAEKLYHTQELLMYMVAHDLKNPIQTINILGSIIKKNIERKSYTKHFII